MQHYTACFLILIGRRHYNEEETWIFKIPVYIKGDEADKIIRIETEHSGSSIYINALYWAFVTTSHVGVIIKIVCFLFKNNSIKFIFLL